MRRPLTPKLECREEQYDANRADQSPQQGDPSFFAHACIARAAFRMRNPIKTGRVSRAQRAVSTRRAPNQMRSARYKGSPITSPTRISPAVTSSRRGRCAINLRDIRSLPYRDEIFCFLRHLPAGECGLPHRATFFPRLWPRQTGNSCSTCKLYRFIARGPKAVGGAVQRGCPENCLVRRCEGRSPYSGARGCYPTRATQQIKSH